VVKRKGGQKSRSWKGGQGGRKHPPLSFGSYEVGHPPEWSIHLFTFYVPPFLSPHLTTYGVRCGERKGRSREKALDFVFLLLFMPNPPQGSGSPSFYFFMPSFSFTTPKGEVKEKGGEEKEEEERGTP